MTGWHTYISRDLGLQFEFLNNFQAATRHHPRIYFHCCPLGDFIIHETIETDDIQQNLRAHLSTRSRQYKPSWQPGCHWWGAARARPQSFVIEETLSVAATSLFGTRGSPACRSIEMVLCISLYQVEVQQRGQKGWASSEGTTTWVE